jgi:hypothetical protein
MDRASPPDGCGSSRVISRGAAFVETPKCYEAACVKDAMSALVRLDYPAYEVIVVDDDSTDDTYQVTLPSRSTWQASAFVQFQFQALNDVVYDKSGNY